MVPSLCARFVAFWLAFVSTVVAPSRAAGPTLTIHTSPPSLNVRGITVDKIVAWAHEDNHKYEVTETLDEWKDYWVDGLETFSGRFAIGTAGLKKKTNGCRLTR